MSKKKRFIKLSSIAIMLVVSIFLSACSLIGGGGGGGTIIPKDPGTLDPSPVDPETPITDLFSKFKVITTGDNVTITDPVSGDKESFNELIDRQLDVLSNDILYRLVVVYGNGFDDTGTNDFILDDNYELNGLKSKINNRDVILPNAGTINSLNYLNEYNELVSNMFGNPIINDPAYYAFSIRTSSYSPDHLISKLFNNTHTIAGGYEWSTDNYYFMLSEGFSTDTTSNYAWNWNYENASISNDDAIGDKKNFINKYIKHYKPKLESAIIQILSGVRPNQVRENLTTNKLDQHKNNIQHIGFKQEDRDNIQEFVLNEIIGESNILADNTILTNLESLFGLTGGKLMFPDEESQEYEEFMQNGSLHYYKAYDVLVPAMLDRAFYNSFGGKEIDRILRDGYGHPIYDATTNKVQYNKKYSLDNLDNITTQNGSEFITLYPRMTRSTDTDLEIVDIDPNSPNPPDFYMLGTKDQVKSVILQPKKGSAVQGIFLAVSGEKGIKFDFRVKVKYVADGEDHAMNSYISHYMVDPNTNKLVNSHIFTVDGEYDESYNEEGEPPLNFPYAYILNISKLIPTRPYPTFNNYDGILGANTNLWNNPYSFDGYSLAGDNYLEFSFEILSATKNGQNYTGPVRFDVGFSDPH